MALNIIETLINGILEPITEALNPVKTTTPKNIQTVAPATTTAVQDPTQAQAQTTVAAVNTPAAAVPTTQAQAQAQPAATTSPAGDSGGGGAAVGADPSVGGASAQTQTAANVGGGGAGALPSSSPLPSPSPSLPSVNGNGVVESTQGANTAVQSSIANNNAAGTPVSLTSNGAGSAKTSYMSLISTFTTTVRSPPQTLTEIIGIEEPYGVTTTITVTGENTKYLTTTDTVTATATSGALNLSKSTISGGKIAGAVIGSLAGAAFLIAAILFLLARKREEDSRRVSTYADAAGSGGYEKQVDHYSKQPLPPLPASDRNSAQQMSDADSRSSNRFSAAAFAARKTLGLSKQQPKPHVLEWPKEFAAGGLGDDVHEGV